MFRAAPEELTPLPDTRGRFKSHKTNHKHELCSKPPATPRDECVDTEAWIRDEADQRVFDNDTAWFDPVRGGYAVWWIERYMRLYQGRWGGEPAQMQGCKTCKRCWTIPREFDEWHAIERSREEAFRDRTVAASLKLAQVARR